MIKNLGFVAETLDMKAQHDFYNLAVAILSLGIFASHAFPQIDPSSAVLLKNGNKTSSSKASLDPSTGVDSGRYTVRPGATPKPQAPRKSYFDDDNADTDSSSQPINESAIPEAEFAQPVEPSSSTTSPGSSGLQALTPIGGAQVNKASAKVGGEASGSLSWFSRWLPGDGRTSLLELSVAPGFLYDGSSSNYSFRNYTSTAETIGVEGKFWISSTLAIDASYKTSVSGDMSDTLNGVGRQISVTHDWLTLGLRNKTTFGTSRYPPSLVFGLDYYCYSLNVPSDSQSRENITSIGALLSVETELPSSSYHAWTLGFYVAPKLQHSESGGSAGFSSGGSTDANMIGFALGSRMRFDHTHSVYWKLSHMIEKDVFSGSASLRDPASGTTPVGVGVTNSFTGLQVGFTWSD